MTQGSGGPVVGERSLQEFLRQALVAGTAIVVPVLVTAVVLLIVIDLLSGLLDPLVIPIRSALGSESGSSLLPQAVAATVLFCSILVVGLINESNVGGNRLKQGLDSTMAQIPGVSSIYAPLDRISELMLEGDTDNFQEVVLVEYPEEGSYSVAFKTAEPPNQIQAVVGGDEMITVFMPMGPNPFMGGFIMHVDEDQVHDVDLTVEEGITSVVSFGVAVEHDPETTEVVRRIDRSGETA